MHAPKYSVQCTRHQNTFDAKQLTIKFYVEKIIVGDIDWFFSKIHRATMLKVERDTVER